MRGLNVYMNGLQLEEKMRIQGSWDNLRKTLEDLPKLIGTFPKMDLKIFPRVSNEVPVVPDQLNFSGER